jgi:YVTN family beta-propeller protein
MRTGHFPALAVLVAAATITGCTAQQQEPVPRPTTADAAPDWRTSPPTVVPMLDEIEVGAANRGMAIVAETGELWVTSQFEDTVTVIDIATRQVVDIIAAGQDPQDVVPDPSSGLVYVADNDDEVTAGVTVMDAATHGVVHRIALPGRQRAGRMALDPTRQLLFATSEDGWLSVIDTESRRVARSMQLDASPDGVAVDSDEGMAYVSDEGGLAVIDIDTLRVVDRVDGGGPGRLTMDDGAGLLYEANSDKGTVTVLDTATLDVVGQLPAVYSGDPWGPWQVILDTEARRAYVTGGIGLIALVDLDRLETIEVLEPEAGYGSAFGIFGAVDPSTDSVFVTAWSYDDGEAGLIHVIERR